MSIETDGGSNTVMDTNDVVSRLFEVSDFLRTIGEHRLANITGTGAAMLNKVSKLERVITDARSSNPAISSEYPHYEQNMRIEKQSLSVNDLKANAFTGKIDLHEDTTQGTKFGDTEDDQRILTFKKELESLINKHSLDSMINVPDFIIANYFITNLLNLKMVFRGLNKLSGK